MVTGGVRLHLQFYTQNQVTIFLLKNWLEKPYEKLVFLVSRFEEMVGCGGLFD